MKIDYYSVLGIEPAASAAAVKKAYRSQAMKYHPDRNRGDALAEEKFKLVNEAYATLGDSDRRRAYDRRLLLQAAASRRRAAPPVDDFFMPQDDDLREFYEGFYARRPGRHAARQRPGRGHDLRQNLKVSFRDAALGGSAEIRVPVFDTCPQCSGTGMRAGASMILCRQCRGKGREKDRRGLFRPCAACGGKGLVPSALCTRCKGGGKAWSERPVHLRIPAGVETGARLQVRGGGLKKAEGGAAGDFIVVVHVEKHPFLHREGLDIVCPVPLTLFAALVGGRITVPALEGVKKIRIKSCLTAKSEIRITGGGVRSEQGGRRGDMVYRIEVEMPKKTTAAEKKLLKQLAALESSSFPRAAAFLKKLQKSG